MKLTIPGLLVLALPRLASAFIGYGISMYEPNCAFACRDTLKGAMLECSGHDHSTGAHSHGVGATPAECRAGDTPWLTSLAYCINATCADYNIAPWKLEKYWADQNTGDPLVQAKWTYAQTLEELQKTDPPIRELEEDEMLTFTALFNAETWEGNRGSLAQFEYAEIMHSRYGIVLLVVGFGTPIFFTLLGHLPYMSTLVDKLKPRFVYPSIVGTYHVRALPFQLGNAPTIGQTWYIAMFLILNIFLTATGYRSYQPSLWFANRYQEMLAYSSARTGVLAFALAPLVVLLSGRNNILLWCTNWSHATYMLLHRWVARIFALQVLLHSIIELVFYTKTGELATEQVQPYWIWGIVATIAVVIMVVASALYFRRLSYEVFLIIHVVMAVFVIAGSWYHVELLFTRKWGYELWLYATCAVWFSDRAIRVLRIFKNGARRAEVTDVSQDIVRIDVKDVRWDAVPGKHTYAYFPSVNPLRPWENHPFSIIPTALLLSKGHSLVGSGSSSGSQHSTEDIEKLGASTTVTSPARGTSTAGISLYVRKSTGLTKALTTHASLLTLLDGPYPNNSTAAVLKTDRLILIAGGIGITATLPFIAHHPNVKLYWSVKANAQGLVNDLQAVLQSVREKQVSVGQRPDVVALLEGEESEGWKRIGVVVCGPGGLCDDVRAFVARRGREGKAVWELDVEAFSWFGCWWRAQLGTGRDPLREDGVRDGIRDVLWTGRYCNDGWCYAKWTCRPCGCGDLSCQSVGGIDSLPFIFVKSQEFVKEMMLMDEKTVDTAAPTTLASTNSPLTCQSDNEVYPRPPTEGELVSLPHVIDRIPFSAWAVILAGAFERFTYFGLIAPWQNYMQNPRTSSKTLLPGALGLGQASATNISNAFFLLSFLTPMLFAVLSDTKLGRYKSLMLGLACYFVGCVIIVATSVEKALDHGAGVPGLAVCMVFIALGAGSVKACFVPFLGDQLVGGKDRVELRDGNPMVVSPDRTLQFVYNAYYWFTNIASLSSIPVTYLELKYGFWQCYTLVLVALVAGIALFVIWGSRFVKVEPQGNVLPKAAKVLKRAAQDGFKLDHAKPAYQQTTHGRVVPWSDAFVEEIRTGLVACRVIFSLLIFYLVISQMYNNLISQAGSMLLSGIPNDLPQAFSGVACIIFGPMVQALYTLLAKHRIRFGPIARLVTAFIFCGLSMVYAAIVQHLIYTAPPCYSFPFACPAAENAKQPNRISIWVHVPVYFFLAIGEILGFVTAFEYAYSKAPRQMRAVVMAFSQLTAGLASVLGMAISPAAKDPNMVIMYSVLAGSMGVTAALFWWRFRQLDEVGRELNQSSNSDFSSSSSRNE